MHRWNSSVMVWNGEVGHPIYEYFSPTMMQHLRGDQDWIGKLLPNLNTLPPDWVVKLRYMKDGGKAGPEPGNKVVLCMPGKNLKAAKRFKWVEEAWTTQ